MQPNKRRVLVCNCEKTMDIDAKALAKALGEPDLHVHSHLCRAEISHYSNALRESDQLLVCCTQEAPLFRELAEEAGIETMPAFTNIRERAGWSAGKSPATAKMAALIAEAGLAITPARTVTLKSDGLCLIYGKGDVAFDMARKLANRLIVTLLFTEPGDVIPPSTVHVPLFKGTIKAAKGHFGAFEIVVDDYAPATPSARRTLDFIMPRNGASSTCSIIIDVSGNDPLFAHKDRLDGYFHIDPGQPAAIAECLFEVADLVGEFEKPLYVNYNAATCAHARNHKTGCTKCLDACPVSAITPEGDHVAIDPAVCGGCGACASVCPTGASSYAMPMREDLIARLQTLLPTYRTAGGKSPVLLIHDQNHGAAVIDLMARFGRGLPANVLPFAVNQVTQIGHDTLAAALAIGADRIALFIDPARRDETDGLAAEVGLTRAIVAAMGYQNAEERIVIIDEHDPDAVEAHLWDAPALPGLKSHDFIASADKRQAARTAFWLLNADAPQAQDTIALPVRAPYGRITVNTEGCTLCLACVSTCPMGAIRDNPDQPQIRFVEQDCVQCGLCATTCPESVIKLEPRLNLTNDAMTPQVLHEEEPAECIRCGKAFGTKSSIERIVAQLAGKHSMFQSEDAQALIRMCDDCRIIAQADTMKDPFAMGNRPSVRTTMDELAERNASKKKNS
jgi:ferredoxin